MSCTSSSCKKNVRKEAKEKDLAYSERNKMVALFSALAQQRGWPTCLWQESDDWWVLFVCTPVGQMSWHLKPPEAIALYWVPPIKMNPWDGHTTEEKNHRIERLLVEMQF